jgi:hypothetical protein
MAGLNTFVEVATAVSVQVSQTIHSIKSIFTRHNKHQKYREIAQISRTIQLPLYFCSCTVSLRESIVGMVLPRRFSFAAGKESWFYQRCRDRGGMAPDPNRVSDFTHHDTHLLQLIYVTQRAEKCRDRSD